MDTLKVIGTDLDDTLHFFKKSSEKASSAVLKEISSSYAIDIHDLESAFREVLILDQLQYFTENKASYEYRSGRFSNLLRIFDIQSTSYVSYLLEVYEEKLSESLELKPGALEFLMQAKESRKKIVVITEGPHDAQERTIKKLGINSYIDEIYSSSKTGYSKSNGLFELVLSVLNVKPEEMIYIGDNLHRDIIPSSRIGIKSYLLDENSKFSEHEKTVRSLREFSEKICSRELEFKI